MLRFTLLLITLLSGSAIAETRYVSDDVFVYLHNGPSTDFRILGSIKSGDKVESLGRSEQGFTQITDSKGRTGWVKSKELQTNPSLREQLPTLKQELETLQARLQNLNGDNEARFAAKDEQIATQQQKITTLSQQLQTQTEQLQRLEQQNHELKASVDDREQRLLMNWLLRGGALVGAGLLLGLLLPYLPRRKSKQERWMS